MYSSTCTYFIRTNYFNKSPESEKSHEIRAKEEYNPLTYQKTCDKILKLIETLILTLNSSDVYKDQEIGAIVSVFVNCSLIGITFNKTEE